MNEQLRGVISPFADALRRARMHRSWSISDVSRETLLSDRQIIGLENDDLSFFYTPAFAERAAVNYAALLGVDTSLQGGPPYPRDTAPPAAAPAGIASAVQPSSLASRLPFLGFAAVVFGLALYAARTSLWTVESPETPAIAAKSVVDFVPPVSATPDAPTIESPTVLPPALLPALPPDEPPALPEIPSPPAIAPPPVTPIVADDRASRFFLVVNRETTISAKDARGTMLLSGVQSPNPGRRVSGTPPFEVVIGDDSAVEIYYLGQRIRPDRPPVSGISVTRAAR